MFDRRLYVRQPDNVPGECSLISELLTNRMAWSPSLSARAPWQQGFSCRQLDEGEEWLDVDYQISCNSDEYLVFVVLGFVAVLAIPIGIPVLTMLLLLKNGKSIREGGDAYKRYEFLVSECAACRRPSALSTPSIVGRMVVVGISTNVARGTHW